MRIRTIKLMDLGFARNRLHGIVIAGFGVIALSPNAWGQTADISDYLETVRTEYNLPALAAAVVQNGNVTAAAAVGTRIYNAQIPVTIDDRFHLGSNVKSMTAVLAGMLVDDGSLTWDSSVGEVLGGDIPEMNTSLAAVTLGEILSHSSGIPSDNDEMLDLYFNENIFDYNSADLRLVALEAWKQNDVVLPDGSPFQYSNFGYMIAGSMIEKVTGRPWEQLLIERIFIPMGMETARIGPQATYGLIDAPVGHRIKADGSVMPMLWGPAADVPPVLFPAGSASMSVRDFAKWAAWNAGQSTRGPSLVTPETLADIHATRVQTPVRDNPPSGTPVTGGYGYGWSVVAFDWAGKPLLTHNGSNSMNFAQIVIDPELDLGVVVLTNFSGPAASAAVGVVMQKLYVEYVTP
ncbi:serine hydrolase domain-containing protein [Falsihalocynthiibacter arcticus]|uniref:Beta-lactamase-related domain-containing protein n=1 Tax=Falsihalocynthiibacter arcticus TaxID=1579316 RepID=A0A126UWP2_9RHOB|nr:serine hydrolase domain-containing protein [Falsihalocynthiibacter arcticus]AML50470.1 hypothetical protein RC74_03575 [Falsihalocynthiibacter arcticus]